MLSISNDESVDVGDRILTAAASCVRDFGVQRVTLAEIARRAGVSRPTVYRRWPDTATILAALLTDRITGAWREVPMRGTGRDALVQRIQTEYRPVSWRESVQQVLDLLLQ
jgi:AcrR family transcriptional regulator